MIDADDAPIDRGEPPEREIPPTLREIEQTRLIRLNGLAERGPVPAFADDGNCLYCGFRPRSAGNLCGDCEARRGLLAARYPQVAQDRARVAIVAPAAPHADRWGRFDAARLNVPTFRNPHNSD